MAPLTPKCLWDSHHLHDFRYKVSGAMLLCLALGFSCSRRQLLNACTLGIHHPCMDWAPKHRTELQRHQQILWNMNRSQTCKTWIQISTTHSNAWEENTECYIQYCHSERRNIQKAPPPRWKEMREIGGFQRHNSIFVGDWRQQEEVVRKRQFVPYRIKQEQKPWKETKLSATKFCALALLQTYIHFVL